MWSEARGSAGVIGNAAPDPEIILDLSRLLSRVLHPTPTGIDRVEMAYAREMLRMIPERLVFAAVHPTGSYGRLPRKTVLAFLDETERLWNGEIVASKNHLRLGAAQKLLKLRPKSIPDAESGRQRVYIQASPHHLTKPDLLRKILTRERARFVCLVHDLIPIQYPEYARPGGAELHRQRMDTLGLYADALIANSAATRDALLAYFASSSRVPPITVAHLGTHVRTHGQSRSSPLDIPYFVCVSTIESRKNHMLLLQIWRRMAERKKPDDVLPKLVLVGRRGWEAENVFDMLDRCPGLEGHVIEASRMADGHVEDLIRGARALLLPSFAEGYGMPIAEALELGVPVICSDLPALREVGRDVPEYLDPLNGGDWISAVKAYALPASARRKAQMERLANWRPTSWGEHVATVLQEAVAQAAIPVS